MKKVFIVGARRTAIGAMGGSLKDMAAPDICAVTIKAALEQAGVNPSDLDETIVGNILTAGQGMGPGRQASIYAGIPQEVPAYSVNILCGSGMKSVMIGASDIKVGDAGIVAASGMENMSASPYLMPFARYGARMGHQAVQDHMILDGLTDVFNKYHMGITAENIAKKHSLSREAQDRFAFDSLSKAKAAIESGRFKDEIVPVEITVKKNTVLFDTDEHPKFDTTLDSLAKLRPAFDKEGTVTAGNASGINDGASTVILASEEKVADRRLNPLAEVVAYTQTALDPAYMGLGPVSAVTSLLEKAGLKITDIDLFELNEAFAAQSLGVIRELSQLHNIGEDEILKKCNLNGGAIALGHPIGASGNRVIVTLLYEMKKRNAKYGIASLCIGGGMGVAILLRNC